jgi:hypothetical protein
MCESCTMLANAKADVTAVVRLLNEGKPKLWTKIAITKK